MKKLFCYILFLLCITAVAQPDSIKYTLTAGKPKVKKKSGQRWIEVPIALTNTTKDTLEYYTMTCSWQDFYTVDNPNVKTESVPCDKNIFESITLPPGKSNTVLLKLYPADSTDIKLSFKIGMNLVFYSKPMLSKEIRNQMHKGNIIWTKPITVKLK